MQEQIFGLPIPIIAAMLTFIGSVVFAPLVTRAITNLFEKKSKLNIDLYAADIEVSGHLANLAAAESSAGLSNEEIRMRRLFKTFRGYIKLDIKNVSNSTVKSISISGPPTGSFEAAVQIGSNVCGFILDRDRHVDVGGLQLGRSVNVHLYSMLPATNYWQRFYKRDLQVTADLIDKVTRRLVVPDHILQERAESRKSIGNIVSVLLFATSSCFLLMQFYYWSEDGAK